MKLLKALFHKYILIIIVMGTLLAAGWNIAQSAKPSNLSLLEGTLTEVFTDCVSRETLSPGGIISRSVEVPCDGGSFVVLDDKTRIQSSSGLTPAEQAYDHHSATWKPGWRVRVQAIADESGKLSLDCETCGIMRIF